MGLFVKNFEYRFVKTSFDMYVNILNNNLNEFVNLKVIITYVESSFIG